MIIPPTITGLPVTGIGDYAFFGDLSLTTVTIPASVTNIGVCPFGDCVSLAAIAVDTANPAYVSLAGVLLNQSETMLIQFPGGSVQISYSIPSSVTSIARQAFQFCTNLTGVAIPNTITNIGYGAFDGCRKLTSVTIPNSVTIIGQLAFAYCTNLSNLTIENGVTNIGVQAFLDCFKLTNVTFPPSVTSIDALAFEACTNLASLTIPGSTTNIGSGSFEICGKLTSVYFTGNPPSADSTVFQSDGMATAYYLPGTTGWSSPFAGIPTVLWNPDIQTSGANFGVQSNQFGFNVTYTNNVSVVVEVCTNLTNPVWTPLTTNTLVNGLYHFSEPFQPETTFRIYGLGFP